MQQPLPKHDWFKNSFKLLEGRVPSPVVDKSISNGGLRYSKKSIEQAVIQKLARYISGLNASSLLLEHGYLQECGVLQRTLLELSKDICFLVQGALNDLEKIHKTYLSEFWEEEAELDIKSHSHSKRKHTPRHKINGYLARAASGFADNDSIIVGKHLSGIRSGFVHGASPQIMEMVSFSSGRFEISGSSNPTLLGDYSNELSNSVFLGVVMVELCAKLVKCKPVYKSAQELHQLLKPYFTEEP